MSDGGKGSAPRPKSVDVATFSNNWDAIFGKKKTDKTVCACYNCVSAQERMSRMIVCAQCGNNRCPHATDHKLACTNSNEPGQQGSRYK